MGLEFNWIDLKNSLEVSILDSGSDVRIPTSHIRAHGLLPDSTLKYVFLLMQTLGGGVAVMAYMRT